MFKKVLVIFLAAIAINVNAESIEEGVWSGMTDEQAAEMVKIIKISITYGMCNSVDNLIQFEKEINQPGLISTLYMGYMALNTSTPVKEFENMCKVVEEAMKEIKPLLFE